jgi:hypothetical protein
MFIDKSHIERIKQTPITDYLQSIGVSPVGTSGHQLVYSSPIVNEKTPSFFVEPKKNVFNDFASGQKGDVVRLVRLIEQLPFFDALNRLESLKGGNCDVNGMCNGRVSNVNMTFQRRANDVTPASFSFSGENSLPANPKTVITKVHTLSNPVLIQYIKHRGISIELANLYLKEVHFINQGKQYFAIGFPNNGDGYELRSANYKSKTANGISVFEKYTDTLNLFEGFFDFLSALQYYNTYTLRYTTIVLNSTSNLSLAYPYLKNRLVINCFLDNDKGGQQAVNQLLTKQYPVINQSAILHPNSKDFNDYLLGKSIKTD